MDRDISVGEIDFLTLGGKTVLVTGATGLIGSNIILTLVHLGKKFKHPIKVVAVVRNETKAKKLFGEIYNDVKFVVGDVVKGVEISEKVDYIIHAASQTSSKAFIERPLETIETAIQGTLNMLRIAKEKKVEKFVYLSTMEVYGAPDTDEKIDEEHDTNLNTMAVRYCYPESKRMCENLCASYMEEYGVPVNVVRLTQTFGPGVLYYDGRIFAEFARCVIEKRDIVLHTKGETKRSYLYTQDAVNAILTVLLKGKRGQAYNAANEETYCSILEMAEMVANNCAKEKIQVKVQEEDISRLGYAPTLKMNLDTSKLQALGWKPEVGLEEAYRRLIMSMENCDND